MDKMFRNIYSHSNMLVDKVRMSAFSRAIKEVVKSGDVVVDIGTGSGILAYFALQAGAKKVYAIEQGPIIEDAKKIAEVNSLGQKIDFIKGVSGDIEIDEKADVVISEVIGLFGLEENIDKILIDARNRFLKPGGRLIPSWLDLYLVPVEAKEIWDKNIAIWNKYFFDLDFTAVKEVAVSRRYQLDCSKNAEAIAAPAKIAHFDFCRADSLNRIFRTELVISKKSVLHGLVGYFKAGLSDKVTLSNSLQDPLTHWEHTFFPMKDAVEVEPGDRIACRITAIPHYKTISWQWDTKVLRADRTIANFSQSSFNMSKEEMVIGRKEFKPSLTPEAKMAGEILDLCDGQKTIEEISEIMCKNYPERYKTLKKTMQEVMGTVSGKVRTGNER